MTFSISALPRRPTPILKAEDLTKPELYFPLKLYVCSHCWLVQTEDYARADELFTSDYAYFSSVSQSWLDHARTVRRENHRTSRP